MADMTISDTEFKKLVADQGRLENAQAEIIKLKEAAENTKKGLSTHRETEKILNAQIDELTKSNGAYKKDVEGKYKNFDEISKLAKDYKANQVKEQEARATNIEGIKTKLGKDLTDDHLDFIDGLDDKKVEKYLTGLLPKEDRKTPNLKTSDEKDKKDNNKKGDRLSELTKNIDNLSPVEQIEYLSLSSDNSSNKED